MIDSSTQAAVGCTKNHTVEGKNWRALNTQSSYCLLNLHIILFISFHHSEMQDCACRKRWSKYHWMHSKRIMPLYVSLPQVDLIFTIILCLLLWILWIIHWKILLFHFQQWPLVRNRSFVISLPWHVWNWQILSWISCDRLALVVVEWKSAFKMYFLI